MLDHVINRSLRKVDPARVPHDPVAPPAPLADIDAAVTRAWAEMRAWTPEQRRANLPALLNAIRLLETRLMVLRQNVMRDIAGSFELVAPSRAGVVPSEDEDSEGD
jgi:hypothetical protein